MIPQVKNKSIVITSIFSPTEAVKRFSELTDYNLFIVGDQKTPKDWEWGKAQFISASQQEEYELSKVLPWNHYCRKMIGYVAAIDRGAEIIIDTDDDNIPKEDYYFPEFSGAFEVCPADLGFINLYSFFSDMKIWPRGFPLKYVNNVEKNSKHIALSSQEIKIGVWQGLADEDPDVDAIYRLIDDTPCYFASRPPVVLAKGSVSPFNSQNTAIIKPLFPLLYLPTTVSFRFTDILRGIVAQPAMWAAGYYLGFIEATVAQKRNAHDYTKDFESEIPCFLHTEQALETAIGTVTANRSLTDNLYETYVALAKRGIVEDREIKVLEVWLKSFR